MPSRKLSSKAAFIQVRLLPSVTDQSIRVSWLGAYITAESRHLLIFGLRLPPSPSDSVDQMWMGGTLESPLAKEPN